MKSLLSPPFGFCSWPVSVRGAGTARHRAAMDSLIAPCRHNVSARDGGIPASRRPRAGAIPVRAPLGLTPNAHPQPCVHSQTNHPSLADAVVSRASDSSFHGSVTAAGPASFKLKANQFKPKNETYEK